jgi:hypothetical protein
MKTCVRCDIEQDEDNFSIVKTKSKIYHRSYCKGCQSLYKKLYYIDNKNYIINQVKEKSLNRIQEIKEYQKDYYLKNKQKLLVRIKNWTIDNKDKISDSRKKRRLKNPHIFAWRSILQNFITRTNFQKTDRTHVMLGYTSSQLKIHLEKLFESGMTWDNYGNGPGKWNVDHVKAVTKFDPTTPSHVVNALSNLQPMWSLQNISKGNK